MSREYIQTLEQSAGRGAAQKNGRQPEGATRSELTMLKVMDKPAKGKIDPTPFLLVSEDRRAALWFQAELEKAKAIITTQTTQLTPQLARVLLGRNPNNRTISEATVSNYVRDMNASAWRFNGEPIIVSRDGMLNDGQHRCMAVILSGATIPVILVIGVERETRTTLDQGRMRTTGDYLSMEGYVDTQALAVAAGFVWQWRKFTLVSRSTQFRATKSEIMETAHATPALTKALIAVSSSNTAAAGSRALLAFCYYVFSIASPKEVVEAFMHGLNTGESLSGASPILYARNRLLAEKSRLKIGERAELIFRSWNAYRRDETPKSIPLQGGELPETEA